jgi:hypothetical protein
MTQKLLLAVCLLTIGCSSEPQSGNGLEFEPNAAVVRPGECPVKIEDSTWTNLNDEPLTANVETALASVNLESLKSEIGEPEIENADAGTRQLVWLHGVSRRSTRTDCLGNVRHRYFSRYFLLRLEVDSNSQSITSCDVETRVFDSDGAWPDPFGSSGFLDFLSQSESCSGWLRNRLPRNEG